MLIDGSGLMEILNLQKLSTFGVSAVVDVNSIKRATYSLKVIISTLYIKLSEAASLDEANSSEDWSFQSPYDWLTKKASENEMCFFSKIATYLRLLRAEREENFELYILTLRQLIKWYFSIVLHVTLLTLKRRDFGWFFFTNFFKSFTPILS